MADKVVQTIYKYKVDQRSLKTLLSANDRVRASTATLAADSTRAEASNLKVARAVQVNKSATDQLSESLNKLRIRNDAIQAGQKYGEMARNIDQADEAAKKLADDLERIGASKAEIAAAARQFEAFRNAPLDVGSGSLRPSNLSRIGSEIRALPSVQIPGAGFGTDAIGNFLRVAGALEKVSEKVPFVTKVTEALTPVLGATAAGFTGVLVAATPVIVAVGAMAAIFITAARQAEEARKATEAGLDAQTQLFLLIERGRREEIESKKTELQITGEAARKQLATLKSIAEEATKASKNSTGEGAFDASSGPVLEPFRQQLVAIGVLGEKDALSLDVLNQKIIDLEKTSTDAEKGITDLNNALTISILQDNERLSTLRKGSEEQIKLNQIAATGTTESINALIAANKSTIEVYAKEVASIQSLGIESSEATARINELQENVDALTRENLRLDSSIRDSIKVREDASAAEKLAQDQLQLKDKFNKDIEALDERHNQQLIDLYTARIDKEVAIAQKAADDSEKAVQALLDKNTALATALERSLGDAQDKANFDRLQKQIKFQRTESEAQQRHLRDIEEIQRKARDKEFDLGLDRDFAGLAASRRATAAAVRESNIQAQEDREQRLARFQQEQVDNDAQFIFEREQKLKHFRQDLDDAQAAERKQLAAIQEAKNKQLIAAITAYNADLRNLNNKYAAEQQARVAAINRELQTVAMGEDAKNALIITKYNELMDRLRGMFNSLSEPAALPGQIVATPFALGGRLPALRKARVNEPGSSGRESFTNANGTLLFPGYGLFQPLSSGTVNSNNRSANATVNLAVNIQTGAGPDAVRQIVPAIREVARDEIAVALQQAFLN